jgi:hypothetical protein
VGDFGVFKKVLLMANRRSLIAWSLWPKDLSKVVVSDDTLDDTLKPFEAERTTMTGKRKLGGSTAETGAGGRKVTMKAGSNGAMTSLPEPLSVESKIPIATCIRRYSFVRWLRFIHDICEIIYIV